MDSLPQGLVFIFFFLRNTSFVLVIFKIVCSQKSLDKLPIVMAFTFVIFKAEKTEKINSKVSSDSGS